MELSLEWFKTCIRTHESERNHLIMDTIEQIELLVGEDKIEEFYVKNLYTHDPISELYFFICDKIIIGKINEQDDIEISIYYKKNIKKLTFINSNNNRDNCKLTVEFNDDTKFIFNTDTDVRSDWSYMFKEKIIKIFKYII